MADDAHLDQRSAPELTDLIGLTERERRFAEAFFDVSLVHSEQASGVVAYHRAFPQAAVDNDDVHARSRELLATPRVQALIAYLRLEASKMRPVPATRILAEIESIAFSNVKDFVAPSKTGRPSVDLSRLTPRTAVAIAEITITEGQTPAGPVTYRTKLKLHSKMEALTALAKLHHLDLSPSAASVDRTIEEVNQARAALPP